MSGIQQLMLGVGGAIVYDADAEAFFTACTTQPSTAAKAAINTLVVGLKADAIWADLDVLWPMALETEQAGRLNLKSPGTFTLTAVNTPTFTAKYGWAGDGSTSYLNTGWDASTNGVQFAQDNASYGCWIDAGTDTANSVSVMGGLEFSGLGNQLLPRSGSNTINARINHQSTAAYGASATRQGLTAIERTAASGANSSRGYRNGASNGTANVTSGTRNNFDFFIGAVNYDGSPTQLSDNRISCVFMGKSLGTTKQTALYNRLDTFRAAMAAI